MRDIWENLFTNVIPYKLTIGVLNTDCFCGVGALPIHPPFSRLKIRSKYHQISYPVRHLLCYNHKCDGG